jgi:hypothetical protein
MPISHFTLQREKMEVSNHPDDSDFEADAPAPPNPFNGPLLRAGLQVVSADPEAKARWCTVALPKAVSDVKRVYQPIISSCDPEATLCSSDTGSSGVLEGQTPPENATSQGIEVAPGVVLTVAQVQVLAGLLQPGRQWCCYLVTGFRPMGVHRFRVMCRNWYGASKMSKASVPYTLPSDKPLQIMTPFLQSSSTGFALAYWVEPCCNGTDIRRFEIQRQRLWVADPNDSDSDPGEHDTDDWVVHQFVDPAQSMVCFLTTDQPDIANLLHYRGKRRFGRRNAIAVPDLRAGKTYRIRMRAENDHGWSPVSAPSPSIRIIG